MIEKIGTRYLFQQIENAKENNNNQSEHVGVALLALITRRLGSHPVDLNR